MGDTMRCRHSTPCFNVRIEAYGDHSPQAHVRPAGRGAVTFMNAVAEALTGWTKADALGQDSAAVFRIVNAMSRATAESPVARVLRDVVRAELLARENARLYRDAQQAVQMRDQVMSVAAHELKTPLTTLIGNVQLLHGTGAR